MLMLPPPLDFDVLPRQTGVRNQCIYSPRLKSGRKKKVGRGGATSGARLYLKTRSMHRYRLLSVACYFMVGWYIGDMMGVVLLRVSGLGKGGRPPHLPCIGEAARTSEQYATAVNNLSFRLRLAVRL